MLLSSQRGITFIDFVFAFNDSKQGYLTLYQFDRKNASLNVHSQDCMAFQVEREQTVSDIRSGETDHVKRVEGLLHIQRNSMPR